MTMNDNGGVVSEQVVRVKVDSDSILPEPGAEFVSTSYVQELTERALAYLEAGYAVPLSPAGTGRPPSPSCRRETWTACHLIHGDDEFGSSDLRATTTATASRSWSTIHPLRPEDRGGDEDPLGRQSTHHRPPERHTLIYDESPGRGRGEQHAAERPGRRSSTCRSFAGAAKDISRCIRFHAIFTSTRRSMPGCTRPKMPHDRLITITLGHYDRATEIAITVAKSGILSPTPKPSWTSWERGVASTTTGPRSVCIAIARISTRRRVPDGTIHLPVDLPGRPQHGHRQGQPRRRVAHAAEGGRAIRRSAGRVLVIRALRRRRRRARVVRRWPFPDPARYPTISGKLTGSPTPTWRTCRSPAWRWRRSAAEKASALQRAEPSMFRHRDGEISLLRALAEREAAPGQVAEFTLNADNQIGY